MVAKGKVKGKGAKGPVRKQVTLEQSSLLPKLKKPGATVGKQIQVPGAHWGTACPAGDRSKQFICAVTDFVLSRQWTEGEDVQAQDRVYAPGIEMREMGEDGTGGASETFGMVYPMPFLTKLDMQVIFPFREI